MSACLKRLGCGHPCCGVCGDASCLPCLSGCNQNAQNAADPCAVCQSSLSAAPCIQLKCSHIFHLKCCEDALKNRWSGPQITFEFCKCFLCKQSDIDHPMLKDTLQPIKELYEDVKRKAVLRLDYEGTSPAPLDREWFNDPVDFALNRFAFYMCFKCKRPYYGGKASCSERVSRDNQAYNASEYVCGGCIGVSRGQVCSKHGTDFIEFKCRFCCSIATYYCFGTTHFCTLCHEDFSRVLNIAKDQLPQCPVGPRAVQLVSVACPLQISHPITGEEFVIGCGLCPMTHTF